MAHKPQYNILALLKEQGVRVDEEGKNCSPGWVQTRCPFCGDRSNHLGYNLEGGFFSCWKCSGKPLIPALEAILNLSKDKVYALLANYRLRPSDTPDHSSSNTALKQTNYGPLKLPQGCGMLMENHKNYLRKRNFDPDYLERVYNLQGTGPIGDYKLRIIAPIHYRGRLVSYQGRDVTGLSQLRYKACRQEEELIEHKKMLYAIDMAMRPSVIVVEGIADAWRLGLGAVSTFGIKFTLDQVKLLRPYKRRFILFDSGEKEQQAQVQAEKLAHALNVFSGENILITLDGGFDPGDMPQEEANALMRDCGLR